MAAKVEDLTAVMSSGREHLGQCQKRRDISRRILGALRTEHCDEGAMTG
ncbi:hypothetical protein M2267_004059 [Ensifer sp. KUDG1]